MPKTGQRRDSKHRILHTGESIRANGKYQFKYIVNGKPKFLYSWRLTPTDPLPAGKQPCLSLRELEAEIGRDMASRLDPACSNMTVSELVARYLKTKTGVRSSTREGYKYLTNLLAKEEFSTRNIHSVKTSDAKLFLIRLQSDGRGSSTIKSVRGILRPAFQMAVDDDILVKNPFGFELAGIMRKLKKYVPTRFKAKKSGFSNSFMTTVSTGNTTRPFTSSSIPACASLNSAD